MRARYVIGLDPATEYFGVACGSERDHAPKSLTWKFPGGGSDFDRTLGLVFDNVLGIVTTTSATDVFIEAPIIITKRSAHTMKVLMQIVGAARAAISRGGAKAHLVQPSTVRKHFLGFAFPDNPKFAVMNRCRILGWHVEDDDAADACATWCYGISLVCPKWSYQGTALFGRKAEVG